jgi:hypothetical protein
MDYRPPELLYNQLYQDGARPSRAAAPAVPTAPPPRPTPAPFLPTPSRFAPPPAAKPVRLQPTAAPARAYPTAPAVRTTPVPVYNPGRQAAYERPGQEKYSGFTNTRHQQERDQENEIDTGFDYDEMQFRKRMNDDEERQVRESRASVQIQISKRLL